MPRTMAKMNRSVATRARARAKGNDNMADNKIKTCQKKGPKGWANIQAGEPLTKSANMVVLDSLKKLDKENEADHVNHWKNLKSTDKVAFALQLKLDKDANCMSVAESHSQTNTTKNTMLKRVDY